MSTDMAKMADRAILKGYVQRTIMCQQTGHVLDVRTAVAAELTMTSGNMVPVVVTADAWTGMDLERALTEGLGDKLASIKVYNGRELYKR